MLRRISSESETPFSSAMRRSALNAAHADLEATHPQPALGVFTPEFFRQNDVQAELARLLTRHPDEASDSQRLAELARTLAEAGEVEAALGVVREIEWPWERAALGPRGRQSDLTAPCDGGQKTPGPLHERSDPLNPFP